MDAAKVSVDISEDWIPRSLHDKAMESDIFDNVIIDFLFCDGMRLAAELRKTGFDAFQDIVIATFNYSFNTEPSGYPFDSGTDFKEMDERFPLAFRYEKSIASPGAS
jgi:hypothetical protein